MSSTYLTLSVSKQQLTICSVDQLKTYTVSTAQKGVGEIQGSWQTPRGWHVIRAKIGGEMPMNTVFVGRRSTGEIYSDELAQQYGVRDWILTRILWLSGLEIGKNRLGQVDTMRRYIYIHGSPDSVLMGIPDSRGCIRMRNADVIDLYNRIPVGTKILIEEYL